MPYRFLSHGDTETALYVAADDQDGILYIGITRDPKSRMRAHARRSGWWSVMQMIRFYWFPTRYEALDVERSLIERIQPPWNRAYNARALDL